MAWDRLLWGAKFIGTDRSFLVGESWDRVYPVKQRPMRTLLFRSRHQAREWCNEQNDRWAQFPDGDPVRRWKVRAVRVRESVKEFCNE